MTISISGFPRSSIGGATDFFRGRAFYSASSYEMAVDEKERKLFSLMKTCFPDLYSGLKIEDAYKLLFMERKDLSKGRYASDKEETNYLLCMLEGYEFMLKTLDSPLTCDLYQALHDSCCFDVRSKDAPFGIPMGFRVIGDGAEAFQVILGSTLSAKGYEELLMKHKFSKCEFEGQTYFPFKDAIVNPEKTIDLSAKQLSFIKLKPTRTESCKFYVNFCIDKFYTARKETESEKLSAIAALCQDLDQMHVFVDGNIRTTGILVLNKMLISSGLSPAVLEDVNCLDCLSIDEIVEKIKEGQVFFRSLSA